MANVLVQSPQLFAKPDLYRKLTACLKPYLVIIIFAVISLIAAKGVEAASLKFLVPKLPELLQAGFKDNNLYMYPCLLLLASLFRSAFGFSTKFLIGYLTKSISRDLRNKILNHMLLLPIEFFKKHAIGNLISTVNYDVEQINRALTDSILELLSSIVTILFFLGVMLSFSWYLTCLALIISPLISWFLRAINTRIRKYSIRLQQSMGDVSHLAHELIEACQIIRIFAAIPRETHRINTLVKDNFKQEIKIITVSALSDSIMLLSLCSVFVLLIYIAISKSLSITSGELVGLFGAMYGLIRPLKQLSQVNHVIARGLAAADSIFQLLDLPIEDKDNTTVNNIFVDSVNPINSVNIVDSANPVNLVDPKKMAANSSSIQSIGKKIYNSGLDPVLLKSAKSIADPINNPESNFSVNNGVKSQPIGENISNYGLGSTLLAPAKNIVIKLQGVSFAYPNKHDHIKLALSDINITFPAGTTTAIVGRSGSGKTTLINLLPRFYQVTTGGIYLNEININQIDLTTLRSYFSVVTQRTILLNDTVANNIGYGMEDPNNLEHIIQAAKLAHAMEFIEQLPQGLDTNIGNNGNLLSGGQRQRLAIARAICKNAPVLILDEATSALDTQSEQQIKAGLASLAQDKTTIIIAHRMTTIEQADQVVVLEDGKVVAMGKHQDLSQNAFYNSLYRGSLQ